MTEIRDYGGWLELSRSALLHNLAGVRRLVGPAQVMAVIKANAYGVGAVGMAGVLQENGVSRFAVATVDEGVELREAGIDGDILCLTYFDGGDMTALREYLLTPTVFADPHLSILSESGGTGAGRLPVWVKVDTGLGRLGMPADRAAAFIEGILRDPLLLVEGVYSTLTENRERDRQQLARLLALREALPPMPDTMWSLASSHGILTLPECCLDVVRPGVMLLGFPPSEPERMDTGRVSTVDMKSVVTWKTHIAGVKSVPTGEQIGYGEQPPLERDTDVASLMIGWSDGYTGSPAAESHVLIGGCRCPVIALSANSTLADVTAIPSANRSVSAGDEAVLVGEQKNESIGVEELARAGGGVYRMLAGVPAHVPRIWS